MPDIDKQPFLLIHRPSLLIRLSAGIVLAALLLLYRFRVFVSGGTHFLGGTKSDAGIYTWLLQVVPADLLSLPWFTTRAFYPYGGSLAWSDNFILPSFVAAPFLRAGLPLPAVYNSILLIAALLTGYFTFMLAYRLTGKTAASLFAGALFMLDPFTASHLGHPQLQFVFWIPLSAGLLFSFMSLPSVLTAALMGLSVTGAFLCSVYYSVFTALVIVVLVAVFVLLRPHNLRSADYLRLSAGTILGLIPIVPFAAPYIRLGEVAGPRALHESFFFSTTVLSWLSAPSFSYFYSFSSLWSHPEAWLFYGFVVYILAGLATARLFEVKQHREIHLGVAGGLLLVAVTSLPGISFPGKYYLCSLGLWIFLISFFSLAISIGKAERSLGKVFFTDRDLTICFAAISVIAFVLSFGPLGYPEANLLSFSPFRVAYSLLPGFDAIRAIGRIGILFHFGLSLLSALALARFESRGLRPLYILPLAVLAIAENYITPYALEPFEATPAAAQSLVTMARENEAAIVLPMATIFNENGQVGRWSEFADLNVRYMNWFAGSKLFLVNGYSGFRSKIMYEYPRRTVSFPGERSLRALRGIAGLKYIIVASRFIPDFNEEQFSKAVAAASGLTLIEKDTEGNYLFRIDPDVELRPDFWMLVPAWLSGFVPLHVKTSGEVNTTLRVFSSERPESLWEFVLPPLQDAHVRIPVTPRANSVVPHALRFEASPASTVTLGPGVPSRGTEAG